MAYITKRGSSYSVRYTYQDEHGKSCDKWESFPTKEEAVKRQKQIEHELATGNFLIPSTVTVAEFLMDWLPKQKRTLYLYDSSAGIAEGCRPGNEGKAAPGTAHLMQKRALIAMQYSALHNRTWKTPTVQKPCRNRAPMAYKTKKP